MRIGNRKTAVALAASATLVIGTGFVASAAVFGLPVLGFGHEPTGSAAAPASTTPPVSVIDQTVYDDHYVTSPGASGGASSPRPATAAFPVGGQAVSGAIAPATSPPASTAAPVPTTAAVAAPPPSTAPATTTTTRPPPPPGCIEPEWDREHHVWQCSNGGH